MTCLTFRIQQDQQKEQAKAMQMSLQKALNMVQSKKLAVTQIQKQVKDHVDSAGDNEAKKSICTLMHNDASATVAKLAEAEANLTRLLIGSDSAEAKTLALRNLAEWLATLKQLTYLLPHEPG